jgi:hypothetical protein
MRQKLVRLLMCLRFATGETHASSTERLKEPTAVKVSLQARASHIGKHDASANPMKLIPDQPDLFDEAPLDGLSQASAIVSPDEEQMLIGSIDATELSPFRFHGWLGKRLTASYGWHYDFDDAGFAQAEAIPDWLLPLRAKGGGVRLPGTNRTRPSFADPLRSGCWNRLAP